MDFPTINDLYGLNNLNLSTTSAAQTPNDAGLAYNLTHDTTNLGPTVDNAKLFDAAQTNTNDNSIFGLNSDQWNNVGKIGNVGLGLGQLGLGVLSYLENKQTADKQRRLLDQQYASNADLIAARKAKRENIRKMFS